MRRARFAPAVLTACVMGSSSTAFTEPLDATRTHRIPTGPATAPAAMVGLDPGHTSVTVHELPRRGRVLWRARGATSLEKAPAVAPDGAVVVAGPGALAQLDARGTLAWTLSMAGASSATTPIIASDGARWVVTTSGVVVAVETNGLERVRRALGAQGPAVEPLAGADGTVVVGMGHDVMVLERGGALALRTRLTPAVRQLLSDDRAIYVLTSDSKLVALRPPSAPTEVGTFGGRVTTAVALRDGHAHAIVEGTRWVSLDVRSGRRTTRAVLGGEVAERGLAVLPGGASRTSSALGLVMGLAADGTEEFRASLEPSLAGASSALARVERDTPGTPMLADPRGVVAHARPGLDVALVSSTGEVRPVPDTGCREPVAVVPAGPRRLVFACRSGLVMLIGE